MLSEVKVGDVVCKANRGRFESLNSETAIVTVVKGDNANLQSPCGKWNVSWNLNATPKLVVREARVDIKETSQALKADSGKLQWELLLNGCSDAVRGVVKVLTIAVTPKDKGGRGYAPHSWKLVPEAETRYRDALFRHIDAVRRGEVWDDGPEGTGEMHVDCIATNALFLSQFEHEKNHVKAK
jgi:hypothetical protein